MSQDNLHLEETLPPSSAQRIRDACERFETAWKSGAKASISDYLTERDEPERSALLSRLLLTELKYRDQSSEKLDRKKYHKLFPDHLELIDSVFASFQSVPSLAETMDRSIADTEAAITREVAGAPVALGDRFGRFQLIGELGRGGFGAVYRAYDPQLDREVALKFPRAGTMVDEQDVKRFMREARSAAQLRHPNIVPVYDAGEFEGTYYIASAFVVGKTLRDLIKQQDKPSHREAAALVAKLAEALHFAHQKGIIHRDVKPENVMIDETGQPHVMDFGLARRDEGEELLTREGSQMGTPAYMSPEQVKGESHTADARTDLWSLGVVLYELLTGQRPFAVRTAESLVKILRDDPQSLRKLDRSIPKDLETICLKCLQKEPTARYESARDLKKELDRFLNGEPIQARRTSRIERTWRWCRRNPRVASLAALVCGLLAVVVVGSLALTSRPDPKFDGSTFAKQGTGTIVGKMIRHGAFNSQEYAVRVGEADVASEEQTIEVKGDAGDVLIDADGTVTIKLTDAMLRTLHLSANGTQRVNVLLERRGRDGAKGSIISRVDGLEVERTDLPAFEGTIEQRQLRESVVATITNKRKYESGPYRIWIRSDGDAKPLDPASVHTGLAEDRVEITFSEQDLASLGIRPGTTTRLTLEIRDSAFPLDKPLSSIDLDFTIQPLPPMPPASQVSQSLEPPDGKIVIAQGNDFWLDEQGPNAFTPVYEQGNHTNVLDMGRRVVEWLRTNEAPPAQIRTIERFLDVLETRPDNIEFVHTNERIVGPYALDVIVPYYKSDDPADLKLHILIDTALAMHYLVYMREAIHGAGRFPALPGEERLPIVQGMFVVYYVLTFVETAYRFENMLTHPDAWREEARLLRELETDYIALIGNGVGTDGKPFPNRDFVSDVMSQDAKDKFFQDPTNVAKISQATAISYARRYAVSEHVLAMMHWAVRKGFYSPSLVHRFVVDNVVVGLRELLSQRRETYYQYSTHVVPLQYSDPWDFQGHYLAGIMRQASEATTKGWRAGKNVEELQRGQDVSWVYEIHRRIHAGQISVTGEFDLISRSEEPAQSSRPFYKQWAKEVWPLARPYYEKWRN